MYDIIIIGSGPAGLAAAIYGQRARLSTLMIEKQPMSGGQIVNTPDVDNYPGLPGVGGFELGSKFRAHADAMGIEAVTAEVTSVELSGETKRVVTDEKTYEGKNGCDRDGGDTPEAWRAGRGAADGSGRLLLCNLRRSVFPRKRGGGDRRR